MFPDRTAVKGNSYTVPYMYHQISGELVFCLDASRLSYC